MKAVARVRYYKEGRADGDGGGGESEREDALEVEQFISKIS